MNAFPLPPGRKRFIAVAVLSGAVVGGMAGLYAFGFAAVRRDARVLAEVRRELSRREERQQAVIAASRTLAGLERERSLIAASFADPGEPLVFVETIERLAERFGARAELQLAGNESRADAYDITVVGPFRGVFSFLERLESLPYLVELDEVDLRGGGAGEAAIARLNISLRLVLAPGSP